MQLLVVSLYYKVRKNMNLLCEHSNCEKIAHGRFDEYLLPIDLLCCPKVWTSWRWISLFSNVIRYWIIADNSAEHGSRSLGFICIFLSNISTIVIDIKLNQLPFRNKRLTWQIINLMWNHLWNPFWQIVKWIDKNRWKP